MSDPFDISKALEGAAVESLSPEVSRFKMNSEYDVAGDQEKAIEELAFQLKRNMEDITLKLKVLVVYLNLK